MIAFFRKLGWLVQRRSKEEGLAAELQFHLEEEAEEQRASGISAQEARGVARRELGNLGLIQEDTRATWSWTLLEQVVQDVRYGARTMLRNPAFTILASLSLALGIGANTAIYSFMDALLMRPLPVADPASLVVLKWHITAKKDTDNTVVHHASGYFEDDQKMGKTSPISWKYCTQTGSDKETARDWMLWTSVLPAHCARRICSKCRPSWRTLR